MNKKTQLDFIKIMKWVDIVFQIIMLAFAVATVSYLGATMFDGRYQAIYISGAIAAAGIYFGYGTIGNAYMKARAEDQVCVELGVKHFALIDKVNEKPERYRTGLGKVNSSLRNAKKISKYNIKLDRVSARLDAAQFEFSRNYYSWRKDKLVSKGKDKMRVWFKPYTMEYLLEDGSGNTKHSYDSAKGQRVAFVKKRKRKNVASRLFNFTLSVIGVDALLKGLPGINLLTLAWTTLFSLAVIGMSMIMLYVGVYLATPRSHRTETKTKVDILTKAGN